MPRLVAGIDGGATASRAVVLDLDSGGVWTGSAGPGNPVNVGVSTAAMNIVSAVEEALRGTGYRVSMLVSAAAALAGLDSRILMGQVAPHIASLTGLGGRLLVEHDAHAAWLHATRGRGGVLVIAGTGSIAYSAAGGSRVIVGDHGWLLGDEGSGFWVARAALRRLMKALDGRRGWDCLTRGLAERLGVSSGDELAYWFYLTRGRVDRIAAVARHVAELAEQGCGEAGELLASGAAMLAEAAAVAAERVGANIVYTTGSMFKSRVFREAFREALVRRGIRVSEARVYTASGALYLALRRAGLGEDEAWSLVDSETVSAQVARLYGYNSG